MAPVRMGGPGARAASPPTLVAAVLLTLPTWPATSASVVVRVAKRVVVAKGIAAAAAAAAVVRVRVRGVLPATPPPLVVVAAAAAAVVALLVLAPATAAAAATPPLVVATARPSGGSSTPVGRRRTAGCGRRRRRLVTSAAAPPVARVVQVDVGGQVERPRDDITAGGSTPVRGARGGGGGVSGGGGAPDAGNGALIVGRAVPDRDRVVVELGRDDDAAHLVPHVKLLADERENLRGENVM